MLQLFLSHYATTIAKSSCSTPEPSCSNHSSCAPIAIMPRVFFLQPPQLSTVMQPPISLFATTSTFALKSIPMFLVPIISKLESVNCFECVLGLGFSVTCWGEACRGDYFYEILRLTPKNKDPNCILSEVLYCVAPMCISPPWWSWWKGGGVTQECSVFLNLTHGTSYNGPSICNGFGCQRGSGV